MSYTYTQEIAASDTETTFVPSYARKAGKTKKIKTWMVLAPIAGVALIGGAAAMLMSSGGEGQPLAEPAPAPAAIAQPAPISSAPMTMEAQAANAPAPVASTTPAPGVAPVARQAEPVRRVQAAPARTPAPVVAPRIQAPVEPTGPRAYEASPAATATVAAPVTSAPAAPVVPAPTISVTPLN